MDQKVGTWVMLISDSFLSFFLYYLRSKYCVIMANGNLHLPEVILNLVIQAADQKVGSCSQIDLWLVRKKLLMHWVFLFFSFLLCGWCRFWSSNTSMFPNFLSIITTILDIFGGSSGSIFGSQMTIYQGLTSTRPDAYGSLLRQGSAAILNSYTVRNYPYTPFQVKAGFRGALTSQQSAAVMAVNFENANHGYGRRN